MTSTPKKRGRPSLPFRKPDGSGYVEGLRQRPDGRWVNTNTGEMFREPDWRLAVARFYASEEARVGNGSQAIHVPHDSKTVYGTDDENRSTLEYVEGELNVLQYVSPAVLWPWLREQLIRRPQWVAERVGIEQIGYLSDLKPKVPLPTPDELLALWKEKATCEKAQVRKVARAWEDFLATTEIETLEQITPELCVAYRDDLHAREWKGKQQQHICTGIRRVVTFAVNDRAIFVKELNEVLVYLRLISPDAVSKNANPQPVEVEDWNRILEASSESPADRAMVLLMLNAALYCKEAAFLEWSDFTKDGSCLLSNRKKTGECIRAAKLWPETIEALEALPRKGDRLFYNYAGLPIAISGAQLRFLKCVKRAGLVVKDSDGKERTTVTAAQLRDGAATAAAEANCNEQLVKLMLGHSSGIGDLYIKRNPKMVQPATDAVQLHYMTQTPAVA